MIFGYFDSPEQTEPAYDPGLNRNCPICGKMLRAPLRTISFFKPGDSRSFFYRIHKWCADEKAQQQIESIVIDGISVTN